MSEEVAKYESGKLVMFNDVQQFQMFLNKEPDKSEIEINVRANNSRYIDIGTTERKLDEIFSGLWKAENFRYQVIANEIVGSIDLHYFHPTAKMWIVRTGAAAAMIQMKSKDKGGSGDITEIRDKITNTLTKDFPHLKAECIKNAAKSIGTYFGRDLNRGEMPDYETLNDKIEDFEPNQIEAIALIDTSNLNEVARKEVKKQIGKAGPEQLRKIVEYLNTKQK